MAPTSRSLPALYLLPLLLLGTTAVETSGQVAPEPGRLRLRVTGASESVLRPYVAVVAETAPWSEPTREAVLEGETVQEWELPPGRYRTAAGAPGYLPAYGPVVELAPGGARTETLELPAMVPVAGRVTGEDGRPLPGAEIAHLRQLVHGYARRLSQLGESHLEPSFRAVAGDDGRFRVLLHPEAGHYLAVRAPGRAPRFFANLRAAAAAATLAEIALAPGASLTVTWPAASADPAPYDRLQLLPADREYPSGLELEGALGVWARPVGDSAPGRTAAWPSLPPGRYEVWLKAPPRGRHDLVPLRLAEVSLAPGQAAELSVALPEPRPAAVTEAAGDPPALDLLLPDLGSQELETLEVQGWWGEAPAAFRFTPRAASGGLLLRVAGACRPDALVTLATGSRLGVARVDSTVGCSEARQVELFPRADVTARLAAPPGESLPPIARVEVAPCPPLAAAPDEPRLELRARIDESGRLSTPVAAACSNVTVRADDFAPLTWSHLELSPGERRDLGSHRLRYGSAVLARVLSGGDGRPLAGVAVRVVEGHRLADALRAESSAPGPAALTSEDGWARLYGLPPGRELVVLLQGRDRRHPHPAVEVELAPGEERVLDALELPPPSELTVEVELSRALEEAEATPYQVFARRTGPGGLDLGLSREIEPDGVARFGELPAGRWRLEGVARAADGKPFPAGSAEIELLAGERETLTLALDDLLFRGRVTYEGIPVEGSMSITPVAPADRRGMSVRLDAEGRFQLPLEGPGTYTVQVYDARDGRFEAATVAEVEFDDVDEPVHIELPDAQLAGRVIDVEGNPVPDARIELRSRQALEDGRFVEVFRHTTASRIGGFRFEGLTGGTWTAVADAGELASEARVVPVAAHERLEGVELVLEPATLVTGTISGPQGEPVPGARLAITPRPLAADEVVPVIRAVADGRGRFTISTAYAGRAANVWIVTEDGAGTAVVTALAPDLRIELPAMGGALVLDLPCTRRRGWMSGGYYLVNGAGAYMPVPALGRADVTPGPPCRLVRDIPGIGSGLWRIVRVRTAAEEALLMIGQGAALESDGEIPVQPGAPLRMSVEPEPLGSSRAGRPRGDSR